MINKIVRTGFRNNKSPRELVRSRAFLSLPGDRPHQFKFDGSYRTLFGIQVSASVRAQSGVPFNALIPHPLYGDNEGFAVQRGTASVPSDAPGGVTAGSRTPSIFQLDLGGRYSFKIEQRQLTISVDWFNVTNAQRAIRLDETLYINSGIPGANFIPFLNPFYGQGTIFQFPSSLRAGIKFTF